MTDMQAVFEIVDTLTDDELAQLVEYAEQRRAAQKPRILGLFEGQGWISDDFTEELPDEFWNFNGAYGYQGGRWKANSDSSQY